MNRLDRLTALMVQLQIKELVTAGEVSKRFNITERTVHRDVATLKEAGIPIISHRG